MKIEEKELVPFKASELKLGGYFYLKNLVTGEFNLCIIDEETVKSAAWPHLRLATNQFSKEGRLFINRNRPWEPLNK